MDSMHAQHPLILTRRTYWTCGLVLMILCTCLLMAGWDRPIAAMHSWAQASGAIVARAHVHYGLGYTHGLSTWATGDPPPENPQRYLDHPQGTALMHGAAMAVFGVNDQALRKETLLATLLSLVILLQILYYLLDSRLALMAALAYVLFPLTAYFGCRQWLTPVAFGAVWYYLLCMGALRDRPPAKPRHYVLLGLMLFLAPQLNWSGFFYAAGIGIHYVLLCLIQRRWPSWLLLSVLAACPLTAMAVNFLIMAAGYQWDTDKIMALYTWRASAGEMKTFEWQPWLGRLWKHSRTNYTVAHPGCCRSGQSGAVRPLAAGNSGSRGVRLLRYRHHRGFRPYGCSCCRACFNCSCFAAACGIIRLGFNRSVPSWPSVRPVGSTACIA